MNRTVLVSALAALATGCGSGDASSSQPPSGAEPGDATIGADGAGGTHTDGGRAGDAAPGSLDGQAPVDAPTGDAIGVIDGLAPQVPCGSGSFCWVSPLPAGNTLNFVWAVGPNDVWTVGNHGTVEHYDGKTWSLLPTGTTADLSGVWASGPADAWAVGNSGTALHYDGAAWTPLSAGTSYWLRGVWSDGTDVWLIGDQGTLLRCHAGACVEDIAANAAGKHYLLDSGLSLDPVDAGMPRDVIAIWGSSGSDIWADTSDGVILHRDAIGWYHATSCFPGPCPGVLAGTSSTNVWTKLYSDLDRWDGTQWSAVCHDSQGSLTGVATSGPNDAWSIDDADGTLYHWDGQSCTTTPIPLELAVNSLASVGAQDFWGVGAFGLRVHHAPSGAAASPAPLVDSGGLGAAAVFLAENDYWVLGRSVAAHWDGSRYTVTAPVPFPADSGVTSVTLAAGWATPGDGLWVTGAGAGPFTAHWDGARWTLYQGVGGNVIWGAAANDIWSTIQLGPNDTATELYHYDGTGWTPTTVQGDGSIYVNAMWGTSGHDIWAVGDSIAHYDGHQWVYVYGGAPTSTDMFRAVWGSSSNDIWAAGYPALLAHYDGQAWNVVSSAPQATFTALWGSSATDVWAGSSYIRDASIWHFDGVSWNAVDRGFDGDVLGGWSSPQGHVWLSGKGGAVLVKR